MGNAASPAPPPGTTGAGTEYSNAAAPEEPDEPIDKCWLYAEVSAIALGVLGLLILVSGLGFFTVAPPGEKELCQIKVLGLQNKTKSDQDFALGTCHALYAGVFNSLHLISAPFIICGALALVSTYLVARAIQARSAEETPGLFRCGIFANLGGLVMVAVPAMVFPSVAGIVAAGLAPIHAYFITIMVGHFAVEATGATSNTTDDPAVREAAKTYETLYLGYCAASRTELCLTIGSFCMLVLVGVYVFDIVRSAGHLCMGPDYTNKGCQLCRCHRWAKKKKEQAGQLYDQVGTRS